jgi:hypothetical protein
VVTGDRCVLKREVKFRLLGQRANRRPQRLGRHLRTVYVSLPPTWSVAWAVSHDRQCQEIAERHANPGIHTNPFEGRSSLLGRLGELLAAWLLALVFGFLGRLPEVH